MSAPCKITDPLVSIGVPAYNRVESIRRCLDALLRQTYSNIEICVSDNASTDGTREICQEYAAREPRIRLNLNAENLGVIPNFNIVRTMGDGEFFVWAATDDQWEPTFVQALVRELLRHPKASAAMCATRRRYEDGECLQPIRFVGADDPNALTPFAQASRMLTTSTARRKLKYGIYTCGLYRKGVLDSVLADCPSDDFGGDRPLNTVIALAGGLRYVDDMLFTKTIHRKPFTERNPDDSFSHSKAVSAYFQKTTMVARWITRARAVPFWRKLFMPFLIGPRLGYFFTARATMVGTLLRRLGRL